jgi:lipoprotein NlpI
MKTAGNTKYYTAAAIAFLAFAVYLPALQNDFLNWDDSVYVVENPFIRSFNAHLFREAFFRFTASNWHPLTWISHALDYAVWGLNPWGHHLTNIVLHGVNTFLVVLLIMLLLEAARERPAGQGGTGFLNDRTILLVGAGTGLLFGLHPLHVESVAWVAERKDLLCALFFLLSMMMYVKYARSQGSGVRRQESEGGGKAKVGAKRIFINKHYLLSLVLFVLALMSKPMAVTLPIVLLILDWNPLERIRSLRTLQAACVEKLPFFILSLASSIVTVFAQKAGGALVAFESEPLLKRVIVASHSVIAYLVKLILPTGLKPFYSYPRNASIMTFEYVAAIFLVAGIAVIAIMTARKHKELMSIWCYYVVTLIPVLGIVQVGGQAMADRYVYLPGIGPFFGASLLFVWGSEKIKGSVLWSRVYRPVSLVVISALFVTLSLLTVRQIGIWNNSIVFWNRVVAQDPERFPLAYNNRGIAFEDQGRFNDALADFNKALTMNPSYVNAYYNRGKTLDAMGERDAAIADYNKVLDLNPRNYFACNNLGVLFGKAGSFRIAMEYFNRAITINPQYADSYFNRGLTFLIAGSDEEALEDFNRTIALKSDFSPAYFKRAALYFKTGRQELALNDLRKACNLGSKDACAALQP